MGKIRKSAKASAQDLKIIGLVYRLKDALWMYKGVNFKKVDRLLYPIEELVGWKSRRRPIRRIKK